MSRYGTATLVAIVVALIPSACVKRSTHEAALAELRRQHAEEQAALEALSNQREAELTAQLRTAEQRIAELEASLQTQTREASRLDQELVAARVEIDRLQTLLAQRGEQYTELQERVLQLARIEREIRERNMIYEDVVGRFRALINDGRVSVNIVRGRLVIQLPQDILFQSGSASLSQDGVRTLREVGQVLATIEDRSFQVEGHTDNVPISTERFPSNWELSSARALSVVRVLLDAGVPPERISGAAYGEYQPVAPNDTPESRRLNRRIEIVMLPNMDVLATMQLPE